MSDVGQISDFRTLLTTLSPDAFTRGKQFERVVKWWLENDPLQSRDIEKVWLWNDWPDRSGPDIGIDLVARLTDGSLMAIQAKCVDESRSIPKSELDSFVSAASPAIFDHKMLVATTDGLSANARQMIDDQRVTKIMLGYLETCIDAWPSSIDHLYEHPVQPKASPRPYQELAIAEVTAGLSNYDRGQLIMACGTGKTLTALWITEQLKPAVTLVLVPSLNLLSQTLLEWAKKTNSTWSYLCVCSDETVNKSDDQLISTVDELPTFKVTTNPDEIATFLMHDGARIIFATYQSSARVAQAQQITGTTFNLVICDEAHRLTGKTDADYATVLDNSKIVADKRLFMTATPRTYTPAAKSKAEDRGVEITSMDEETVYGPVLHKLSFGEAIKQDLLSDYRVLIVGVTDPQVQDLIDRRELVSVNDTVTTDARTLAAHIGLAKATKDYNLKRTISFHSRIKSADQFAQDHIKILDWLPDTHKPEGTTWTGTISGAMNTGERRRLLTQLKQDDQDRHALLTNARCLTEGVDVPSLDGVAFIDPRSSQVDIIQAVGRAIRKSANKEIGTIVLPVLIPTDADAEHALEDTAFKPIWAILNALKSHDEELAVELNNLRTELGQTGKVGQLPDRLVEDLPIDIDSILPGFSDQLLITVVGQTGSTWNYWYGLLLDYVEKFGTAYVNQINFWQGRNLGSWVNKQRTLFRRDQLNQEQISLLSQLAGWTWDPIEDQRQAWIQTLKRFVQREGHARVPATHIEDGQALGGWVSDRRSSYLLATMSAEEKAFLESLPGWSWDPLSDDWRHKYDALKSFVDSSNGKFPANPRGSDNSGIGKWVVKQRERYRKQWTSEEQIALLEAIPGWKWDPLDENWNASFEILKKYSSREGHSRPPATHCEGEVQLGIWVSQQRDRFKKKRVLPHQQILLESLPSWSWDPLNDSWSDYWESCSKLPSTNPMIKRGSIPKDLLEWMKDQRERYQSGQLSAERIKMMETLPGWLWEPRSDLWDQIFWDFYEWAQSHDPNTVPKEITFGGANGRSWSGNVRTKYRKGLLSNEQISQLESVPGWEWQRHNKRWQENFLTVQQVINTDKLSYRDLPPSIIEWVRTQRRRKSNGTISQSEIELLETLPGWGWDPPSVALPGVGELKPVSKAWLKNYEALKDYAQQHGTSSIAVNVLVNELNLGKWVSHQRNHFKFGGMDPRQIELLEQLPGWKWSLR